jgi:hypothetical protein
MEETFVSRFLSLLAGLVSLTGCSVFGIPPRGGTPAYAVVGEVGPDIELRHYDERPAIETTVAGEEPESGHAAFEVLSQYLSGANRNDERVAMTAPVEVDFSTGRSLVSREVAMAPVDADAGGGAAGAGAGAGGQTTVRIYFPAGRAWESLPEPTDPRVRLLQLPDETLAVMRLRGSRPRVDDSRTTTLLVTTREAGWRAEGKTFLLLYDPQWTIPFLRRTELAVRVFPEERARRAELVPAPETGE